MWSDCFSSAQGYQGEKGYVEYNLYVVKINEILFYLT